MFAWLMWKRLLLVYLQGLPHQFYWNKLLHHLYEMVIGPITRGARFLLVRPLDVWLLLAQSLKYCSSCFLWCMDLSSSYLRRLGKKWTKQVNRSLAVSCCGGFRPSSIDRKKAKATGQLNNRNPLLGPVLRIRDILVRIRGSVSLTIGSGSGSCYFHQSCFPY